MSALKKAAGKSPDAFASKCESGGVLFFFGEASPDCPSPENVRVAGSDIHRNLRGHPGIGSGCAFRRETSTPISNWALQD
jgi:hypothetical protein